MVTSTPQQPDAEQGPSNDLGSGQPTEKTPTDILLIIFIHGYCVRSIYMRGHFLVTRTPFPVSKEMTQHLETFPHDYSISSQRMLRVWWLNLLSFRPMKCVSSRVFFLYTSRFNVTLDQGRSRMSFAVLLFWVIITFSAEQSR